MIRYAKILGLMKVLKAALERFGLLLAAGIWTMGLMRLGRMENRMGRRSRGLVGLRVLFYGDMSFIIGDFMGILDR